MASHVPPLLSCMVLQGPEPRLAPFKEAFYQLQGFAPLHWPQTTTGEMGLLLHAPGSQARAAPTVDLTLLGQGLRTNLSKGVRV